MLLFACNRVSALIWNDILRIAKEYSLAHDGKWIQLTGLCEALKQRYPMHSQSVQSVAKRYLFARDAARAARLKGYKNRYPWRLKKNYNTRWIDKAFSFNFGAKTLSLSLGNWDGKRQ